MSTPATEISGWLEKLGMSEYAQCFAESKIDVSVLRHLTDQDLKDIGVPLGHRRKMLAAIGELAGPAHAKPAPAAGEEPKPQDAAERRQVTVMFSDLVGSTALSARMERTKGAPDSQFRATPRNTPAHQDEPSWPWTGCLALQ